MPTPFAVFLASDHEICELAEELIYDEKMHLHNLKAENLVYFLIGGLTPKAADAFGFGKVEKKTGTDALAYLGRFNDEAARKSMETTCDMDETVFLVKISRRWWEAAALDVKNGTMIQRQNLHRLLCSIVPSENGGQIAKPDITIYTEQVAAFGKDLADLGHLNKLLERYDSGGQEQLPLGEDEGHAQGASPFSSPDYLAIGSAGLPALPAVGENLPALVGGRALLMIEGSKVAAGGKDSEIIEGEIVEDLTPYLLPLVLNEEPRKNEYGSISSVCTTLEQMLADLKELETDDRHAGHYAFSVAALKAGLGFMFIRQWTGQKSAWTQAINLAQTITGNYRTDFPKAMEMLPAFAAHLEATKTPKNPKAGLKSWKAKTGEGAVSDSKPEPSQDRIQYRLAYAHWLDGCWEQGGLMTEDDLAEPRTSLESLTTLAIARALAQDESKRQPMLLIHVTVTEDKGGFHSERGDLWFFRGKQVGSISCGLPSETDLKAAGAWNLADDQLSDEEWERSAKVSTETVAELFAASEIQPAVSITELANIEAEKLIGGGASSSRSRRAA